MQPLVSIITVVYNGEKYISTCLKSIVSQTYSNVEHIIIDGGSSDSTLAIVEGFDHVVKVISEPDNGIYNAMNKGLSMASGEIVGILNSDDFYYPRSIEQVVREFQASDVGIIYGNMNQVVELSDRCLIKTANSNIERISREMSIFHPTMFVKKSVYDEIGGFDEQYKIAADYEFVLRALKQKIPFKHIDSVLTGFRVSGKSFGNCTSIKEGAVIMERYKTGFANEFRKRLPRCRMRNLVRAPLEFLISFGLLKGWREQRIIKNWERG